MLSITGFIVGFGSLIYLYFKNKQEFTLFFCWFLVSLVFFINLESTQPRFFLPVIIPLLIAIGIVGSIIYQKNSILSVLFIFCILISMFISIYPILSFRHTYSSAKEFAQFINRTTESNSTLILYGDDVPLMTFYTTRQYIDYPINTNYIGNFINSINVSLEQGKPVYLSETVFILDNKNRGITMYNFLLSKFKLEPVADVLWENPHRCTVISQKFTVTLFRIKQNI